MKKMFLALAIFATGVLYAATPGVDEKIEKSFKEAFPKAEKVTWYEGDKFYEVLFENETVKCRMWYNKGGEVVKTERYYKEDGLCPIILAQVKSKYNGKKVFGVTEVNNEEGIRYYIILEDDKRWYHVNSDDSGNLYIAKKYIKA